MSPVRVSIVMGRYGKSKETFHFERKTGTDHLLDLLDPPDITAFAPKWDRVWMEDDGLE